MAQIVDDRRDPGRDHGDPDRPDLPRARPVRRPLPERRAGHLRRPGGARRRDDGDDRLRRPGRFRHAQPRAAARQRRRRRVRSAACPAPPPAAPSSPTGPMAAATSSTTSPTRRRPPWTPRSSSPACSRAAATSTSWARRCSAPASPPRCAAGVELARAAGAQISFDPNIRKELLALPEVAATIEAVLARHRPAAAQRGRSRASLPRPSRGRGGARPARRRAVDGAAEEGCRRAASTTTPSGGSRRRPSRPRRSIRPGPGTASAAPSSPAWPWTCRSSGRCAWPMPPARWRWQEGADGGQLDHGRARGLPGAQPMSTLREIARRNRAGRARGIWSVCSAHPLVLEACIDQALADGAPLLVEATCNQVNQDGGYTGMRAGRLPAFVAGLAAARGLPLERLILGGDHLGPNPWRRQPADAAMDKAEALVRSYAAAGFGKLHLDASMACAGDPEPAAGGADRQPGGAAVPGRRGGGARPAGLRHRHRGAGAGRRARDDRPLEVDPHRGSGRDDRAASAAFAGPASSDAWERVLAVVVQPGVEFGSAQVADFVPERARGLAAGDRARGRPRLRGALDRLPDRGGAARSGRRSTSRS